MRYNPLITPGRAVRIGKEIQANTAVPNKHMGASVYSDQNVYLLIRDLWEKETDCVLDMQVVNMDANYYQLCPP